jgi:hypothetical protein
VQAVENKGGKHGKGKTIMGRRFWAFFAEEFEGGFRR